MGLKNRFRAKVLSVVVSLVVFCGCGANFLVVSADDAPVGGQNETTAEKLFNYEISEKNQKSKFIDFRSSEFYTRELNPEGLPGGLNGLKNLEKFKDKAEKLYIKVKDFIKDSDQKGVTAENFEEYVRNFVTNDDRTSSKMRRGTFDEFKKMKGQPEKFLIIYRGVPEKSYADSLLDGQFWCGGRWRCRFLGSDHRSGTEHGMYTTTDFEHAENYERKKIENKSCESEWNVRNGGVVEMAIDLQKTKIIERGELEAIKNTMLCLHPEFADYCKVFNKMIPKDLYYSSAFKYYAQAFKETFGFDVLDIRQHLENELIKSGDKEFTADKIKAAHEDEHCTRNEHDLYYRVREVLDSIVFRNKPFCLKFSELMEQNKEKIHIINKEHAIANDLWFLAKLMGYDAVSNFDLEKLQEISKSKDPNKGIAMLGIVNPEVLIVNKELPNEGLSCDFSELVKDKFDDGC